MTQDVTSFDAFFPYYVSQHSRRATRWMHFAGTHLGVASAMAGMVTRRPRLVAAAPVISYGMAWFSHFVIEGNNPATFGHPLWSLRGDFVMLGMMWRGQDDRLDHIARTERSLRVAA
jgi:hypothetical protein